MPSLVAFTAFTALVAINAPSEEQTPAEGVYLPTNEAQLKNTPQDLGVVEIWRYRGGTTNRIAGALSAEGPRWGPRAFKGSTCVRTAPLD